LITSPELLVIILFVGLLIGLGFGFPVPFVMLGISLIVGVLSGGTAGFFNMMVLRVFETMENYILASIILFIYMGIMLDRSGMGDKLFRSAHVILGGLPGGLALAVIVVCTIMAASTGIMGAPVMIMGLVALPIMLKSGYDPTLSCGTIMAGGCLGILIPPSIMLVVYGPMAGLSVGKLLMAAFLPGLLLSALYIFYIIIRCAINPKLGPPLPPEERNLPLSKKASLAVTAMGPPLLLIFAVLGTLFFGIAAPTEAAGLGALAGLILTVLYRKLDWKAFKESAYATLRTSSMILIIVAAAYVFTGTFMMVGGGDMVQRFLLSLPVGRWGVMTIMCFAFFICGFFMEWPGILPILVPIFTPIIKQLGFDPIVAAMAFCVTMQTSFLTPPMAPALFYLKGVAPKEINFVSHICKGAVPFIVLQLFGLVAVLLFPQLSLWLPSLMLR
jgi:tripartite ATP-independent transporter DctM subunit